MNDQPIFFFFWRSKKQLMEGPGKEVTVDVSVLGGTDFPNVDYYIQDNEDISPLSTEENIDPIALHFIPYNSWANKTVSLAHLRETYFSRKNNVNRRFEHKLWNALQITKEFPKLVTQVGVIWITNTIFKVYKNIFANLLNIKCVNGGLFHKQGNFTCHGFVVLTENELSEANVSLSVLTDVDFRSVVCVAHKNRSFAMDSQESTISECRWDNPVPPSRAACLKLDAPIHQPFLDLMPGEAPSLSMVSTDLNTIVSSELDKANILEPKTDINMDANI